MNYIVYIYLYVYGKATRTFLSAQTPLPLLRFCSFKKKIPEFGQILFVRQLQEVYESIFHNFVMIYQPTLISKMPRQVSSCVVILH